MNAPEYKTAIRTHFDRIAPERATWTGRNSYFYDCDRAFMRFLVPPGARVLEIGCGNGDLLAELAPSVGVGLDISPEMVRIARDRHPDCTFIEGDGEDPETLAKLDGSFDVIVLSDVIGLLYDFQTFLERLQGLCDSETRIVVAYYSHLWEPVLRIGETLGIKSPSLPQSWMMTPDIRNFLDLAGFETVKTEYKQLLPRFLLGLGPLVNKFIATLPVIRHLCLRHYVVARSLDKVKAGRPSVSIVVPCRNEAGNIEAAVTRTPRFSPTMEFVFVEGGSADDTHDECIRVKAAYPELDIKVLRQPGKGKGDAVRTGFDAASGDVLMILDADLTVPPETLPRFYDALARGKGEFINGSRLVYPSEKGAMRFLNVLGNRGFARIFSYLLNQRFTDTLCGTKVLRRAQYQRIADNRSYFGEFDPFGDFDLIFGAARLNLKILEMPIRYADRTYGTTNISRFRHGWLLLRMVVFAYRKMKAL